MPPRGKPKSTSVSAAAKRKRANEEDNDNNRRLDPKKIKLVAAQRRGFTQQDSAGGTDVRGRSRTPSAESSDVGRYRSKRIPSPPTPSEDSHDEEYEDDADDHDLIILNSAKNATSSNELFEDDDSYLEFEYIKEQMEILKKQNEKILKGIEEIREHQRADQQGEAAPVPAHHMIHGQNAMLWPARTGRKFCLDLMTAMFTKEEMGDRLAIISQTARKRTKKSTLPADKIEQIIKLVQERFPSMTMHELKDVMNQKCRDSAPRTKHQDGDEGHQRHEEPPLESTE